jgi:uncharacterized membrane protein HdeD (DUF308 family)
VLRDGIVTAVLGGMFVVECPNDSVWLIDTLFAVSLALSAVSLLRRSC